MANLEELFNYYLNHQDVLVEKYNGKYIVIINNAVVGAYDSEADAYFEAEHKYGLGNFLIQYCSKGDEAYTQTFTTRVIFA